MDWRTTVVVAFVVLAGCSSFVGTPATSSPTTDTADTGSGSSDATATAVGTPDSSSSPATTTAVATPTATPTPRPPANPWRAARVTIALVTNGHAETDHDQALQSAVAYWNENTLFANYTVELVYPNATGAADIEESNLPAPFRASSASARVSDWWTQVP